MKMQLSTEEWADKIADDIAGNRHSYQKHCRDSLDVCHTDGSPLTRDEYRDLIKRTLMDTKAIARTEGSECLTMFMYSHETKMVVFICPRMTGDASTAYPLAERAPMKFPVNCMSADDMHARALQKKSVHDGLIYNQGEGFPRNARECFQTKFEIKDAQGHFMSRNRNGERISPVTGPDGPFAEWLKIRAVPQKLSTYFQQFALGQSAPPSSYRYDAPSRNAVHPY